MSPSACRHLLPAVVSRVAPSGLVGVGIHEEGVRLAESLLLSHPARDALSLYQIFRQRNKIIRSRSIVTAYDIQKRSGYLI